jgi:S1-C subfamily serine protease
MERFTMATLREQPVSTPLASCSFLFLLLAALGGIGLYYYWPEGTGHNPLATPRVVEARGKLADIETANISVYEQSAPSVVQVTTMTQVPKNWYNFNVESVPKGVGSGFIWDQDGYIVTNYHVIQNANSAKVTLSDHSTYETQNFWGDQDQDIAVLLIKAPRSKLHPIRIGSSHDLKVGQMTYAFGDPFGFDQTMTTGIVSALGRTIESTNRRAIEGVIQTSAAINPGNSGGPLMDSAGRLIGMNTAIASPSGAFAGIGFAIPVDEINRVVPQLIQHGKVVRPRLGVQLAGTEIARQIGVEHGALIVKVVPDSGAAKAGLKGTTRDEDGQIILGEVIVAIDGKKVENASDVNAALQKHKAGDTVTLTITKAGKREDVKVTLGEAS